MPEKRIRFGVRDDQGRRASPWTLALRVSADRPEVYLCVRNLGGVVKTSFHAYGMWRHAYVKGRFNDLFEGIEGAPEDRCIEEWPRPAEHGLGITWAVRIFVPPSGALTPIEAGLKAIHWVTIAPPPRWTEIDIFFLAPGHAIVDPIPTATDFGVIATEQLGNGESVHVVHQSIPPPQFAGASQHGEVRYFSGCGPADLLEAEYLRGLARATDAFGTRILIDFPVEIDPSAAERLSTG
jgi:hypothetical protein